MKKKIFITSLFLCAVTIMIAAFAPAKDDTHYYFDFDSDHGHYTNIISCTASHHVKVHKNTRGSFYKYGPYETYDEAKHSRDAVVHKYNENHDEHAEYLDCLLCSSE